MRSISPAYTGSSNLEIRIEAFRSHLYFRKPAVPFEKHHDSSAEYVIAPGFRLNEILIVGVFAESDDLCTQSEEHVFNTAILWIEAQQCPVAESLKEVFLRCVRFSEMDATVVLGSVLKSTHIINNESLHQHVLTVLDALRCHPIITRTRGSRALLVVGMKSSTASPANPVDLSNPLDASIDLTRLISRWHG
jgi:hypothetical protein